MSHHCFLSFKLFKNPNMFSFLIIIQVSLATACKYIIVAKIIPLKICTRSEFNKNSSFQVTRKSGLIIPNSQEKFERSFFKINYKKEF